MPTLTIDKMDAKKVLFARLTQKGQRAFIEYVKKVAMENTAIAVEQDFVLSDLYSDFSLGDVVEGVKDSLCEEFSFYNMEVDIKDWVAKAREDYFLPEVEGDGDVVEGDGDEGDVVDMSWMRNKRKRSDIDDAALVSTLSEEDFHVVKEALKAKYDSYIDTAFDKERADVVGETRLACFTYEVENHVMNME